RSVSFFSVSITRRSAAARASALRRSKSSTTRLTSPNRSLRFMELSSYRRVAPLRFAGLRLRKPAGQLRAAHGKASFRRRLCGFTVGHYRFQCREAGREIDTLTHVLLQE